VQPAEHQAVSFRRGCEPDRQHEIMTEIFVDSLQAQLTRQRPSK
jgi:hypothetical protein